MLACATRDNTASCDKSLSCPYAYLLEMDTMRYEPTYESLGHHDVPDWFHDAKLGILVTWGLFSVPAWAPPAGNMRDVLEREGWPGLFARNPYAEWYWNSVRFTHSPTQQYHVETYGQDFAYEDFVPAFTAAVEQWDPEEWAALFAQAGVRYVVFLTKHHDGFLLWPSNYPNPYRRGFNVTRDLPGELAAALRRRGMRMGVYYSGGPDWTFKDTIIRDVPDLYASIPQGADYVAYANAHWRELIDRYAPSIMWNDIGYPAAANLPELFAYYYNRVPDGVINDRFGQVFSAAAVADAEVGAPALGKYFDFRTPEYSAYDRTTETKWEATRGIGHSFGYNQNEGPEDYLSVNTLVRMFVDNVSKNGNLLVGVGPMADGRIPALQQERLVGLGAWLQVNGEAIFATRPWVEAEGHTHEGISLRYTHKGDTVFAILLDTPQGQRVTIEGLHVVPETTVHLLGHENALLWTQADQGLVITLPNRIGNDPPHALKIAPMPSLGLR